MQVKSLPALYGWRWVVEGFTVLMRAPGVLLATGALLLFTLLLSTALPIPLLGALMPLVLAPVLGFGFVQVTREVLAGRKPSPFLLYRGFGAQAGKARLQLLLIGLINAAATLLALLLTQWIDGGSWSELLTGRRPIDATTRVTPATVEAAVVFFVLYALIQLPIWLAPLFSGLHAKPALQALFFSVIGIWRNKAAFFVYFGGWFAVALGWGILVRIVTATLSPTGASIIMMPGLLILMVALYGSFWATFRDIVEPSVPSSPAV